jgi:hypothetical protein
LKNSLLAGSYSNTLQKNLPLEPVRKTLEEAGIFSNSERFCAQTPVARMKLAAPKNLKSEQKK